MWLQSSLFWALLSLCLGIEIINYSGEQVAVRKGEPLELSCETDSEYHFCYWEHNAKKFFTNSGDKEMSTELFSWVRTDTVCAIRIETSDPAHEGIL